MYKKDHNKPFISIIIPAYNVEAHISRCIMSTIKQTLKEIEIIIVNDGSTDNTKTIIEELAKQDNRITVINKQNNGVSSARNMGLNIAKGDYIQYLDGDDWIEPNTCEEMYTLAKEKNLDIVVSNFYRDDNYGNIDVWYDLQENKTFYTNEEYLTLLFKGESFNALWNKLFSKKIHQHIRHPVSTNIGEDFVVLTQLIYQAERIGKIHKAFLHYIVNPLSITQTIDSTRKYQLFEAFSLVKKFLIQKNIYDKYKDSIAVEEFKIIKPFLKEKPRFENHNYQKSLDYILEYLRAKPSIPKKTSIIRTCMILFLINYPTKNNLKKIIKLNNLFSNFKK